MCRANPFFTRVPIKKPFRIARNGVVQPSTGLGRKGFAAAAALAGIRVSDLETAAGQFTAEIYMRTAYELGAERINKDGDPVH